VKERQDGAREREREREREKENEWRVSERVGGVEGERERGRGTGR